VTYPTISYGPFQFYPSGNQNGRPKWVSGTITLGWSLTNARWEITPWTSTAGIPVSTDPSRVPLASWTLAGGQGTLPQIYVTQGTCPAYVPLTTTVSTQNTSCSGTLNCNGSITITTQGGQSPYQYSINNGNTFQGSNIFNGLCSGTYTVITKDALNNTNSRIVTVGFASAPVTYTISAYLDIVTTNGPDSRTANWYVDVQPQLPLGTTISFTLNVNNSVIVSQPGNGTAVSNTLVYRGNTLQTASNTTTNNVTQNRPNCSPYTQDVSFTGQTYNLTITSAQGVSGTSTSSLSITSGEVGPNGCATLVNNVIEVSVSNATINGCNCCSVDSDTTPQGINLTKSFGGGTNQVPLPRTNPGQPQYFSYVMGLGTSVSSACSNYQLQEAKLISSEIFGTGVAVYQGSPNNPTLAVGYIYCTDNLGQVYEITDGIVGLPTGDYC
jgi:hypothetical protein